MKYQYTLLEKIKKNVALILIKLPLPIIKFLIGKPIVIDGQTLDPYLQFIVQYFDEYKTNKIVDVEEFRRELDLKAPIFSPKPNKEISTKKWNIKGPNGNIPCEIYRPKNTFSKNTPVLIYFHGGGHVCGSLNSHRNICKQIAYDIKNPVIAVDYRLAPEHKFPAGLNDGLAVYDEVVKQSEKLGFNSKRISIGGDSAGANLVAIIAQQRKKAKYPPKFQFLWVPWVDLNKDYKSYELFGEGFLLEKYQIDLFTDLYLNDTSESINPLVSPIFGDVTGVCNTAIFVAGFDPNRDQGIAYAKKLKEAEVNTFFKLYEGAIHSFIGLSGSLSIGKEVFNDTIEILKKNM